MLLGYAASLFFPWWIIAVTSFLVAAAIRQGAIASFLSGFLGLFILWAAQSFYLDAQNEHLLSKKVASILPLGGAYIAVIILAALLGGLVAGMAALTASFLRGGGHNRERL